MHTLLTVGTWGLFTVNKLERKGDFFRSYGLFTLKGTGTGHATGNSIATIGNNGFPVSVSDQCEHFCILEHIYPGPFPSPVLCEYTIKLNSL